MEPNPEKEETEGKVTISEKVEPTPPKEGEGSAPAEKPTKPAKDVKKGEEGAEDQSDFKYIVRIANTDIDGNKTVQQGLTSIKGIGIRLSAILVDKVGLDRTGKIGELSDEDVDKLIEIVKNITEIIPTWGLNRQRDVETGQDLHIYGAEIFTYHRDDLNRLKKIRCYRGIRHERGHKVRGQRTRSNGRSGLTVGVVKKSIRLQQAKASAGKAKKKK